jgi:hypothetical protein
MHRIPFAPNSVIIREAQPAEFMFAFRTGHMITPRTLLNWGTTIPSRTPLRTLPHQLLARCLFPLLLLRIPLIVVIVFFTSHALMPGNVVVYDAGFGA